MAIVVVVQPVWPVHGHEKSAFNFQSRRFTYAHTEVRETQGENLGISRIITPYFAPFCTRICTTPGAESLHWHVAN